MRRCLSCDTVFDGDQDRPCPNCGHVVAILEGVPAFSPESAHAGPGFNPERFAWLADRESGHFWFKARSELIAYAVERYFPSAQSALEIGCGTGYVLQSLASRFPHLSLSGSEIFIEGLKFAGQRLPQAQLFQMDARRIPFRDHFDLIGAFDVIEHIDEDEAVLEEVHSALKPGGGAVFTVPQHPWLWSAQDERACHKRRYRRGELEGKLEMAGFSVVMSTSFVSFLLPLLFVSRRRGSGQEASESEFAPSPFANALLYQVLRAEGLLIRAGVRFPAGGSRLVVARRRDIQAP